MRAGEDAPEPAELAPIAVGQQVERGAVVHLEVTMWNERGEFLDSTRGRPPLAFTVGQGEVIAGLERAVVGTKVGERRRITVPPVDAYGPVDEAAVAEVLRGRVPPEAQIVGARLPAETRSGRTVAARVREVRAETVVLDFNHPLAGQTLVLDVQVVLVEPP